MGTQENHFQVKESKAPELTALDITEDISMKMPMKSWSGVTQCPHWGREQARALTKLSSYFFPYNSILLTISQNLGVCF